LLVDLIELVLEKISGSVVKKSETGRKILDGLFILVLAGGVGMLIRQGITKERPVMLASAAVLLVFLTVVVWSILRKNK